MGIDENLIHIGSFKDSLQANMAKEILQSNNISCRIVGDAFQIIEILPASKISLQIHHKNLMQARELLDIFFNICD
jgi:hypothetical protein